MTIDAAGYWIDPRFYFITQLVHICRGLSHCLKPLWKLLGNVNEAKMLV